MIELESKILKPGCCVIINEFDRPCGKNVAVIVDKTKSGWVALYLDSSQGITQCYGGRPTPLADFGYSVFLTEVFGSKRFMVKRECGGRATYADGDIRVWQGDIEYVAIPKKKTLAFVLSAIPDNKDNEVVK